MKNVGRIYTFFIFAVMVSMVLYFQYGTPPLTAIPTKSMEPELNVGDLVIIRKVTPSEVKVGDVIVVRVPKAVQDRFNYPPSIIHRVVEVNEANGTLQFRIKGDNNNGEDPFTVLPEDIMGTDAASYRYLGYLILFLNSKQGFYFILSSFILYLLYVIFDELEKREISLRKGIALFFFSDLFQSTKQIEKGQKQIMGLLRENVQKRERVPYTDMAQIEKIIHLIERNRRLIKEQTSSHINDPAFQELIMALVELEQELDLKQQNDLDRLEHNHNTTKSMLDEKEEWKQIPPRKRNKRFFKKK
ncbi:signal peptidase I [Aquibacillus sp. 3ASR75-11]|uniref:Signal peptidase I n=1 Tax=Terrihalobacillus insolitus TaxID=2950438 RepID=A0A9X3WWI8_9BACI|nr:signal peptidase I [Terrihalobacillus insolitus]MDC3414893.1 signal peptidase I [Terrihalobacillus insolitus]MDC3426103.1 signal peptidase I [Terrihalobacillus insolitus]